ncbi:MAG: hypothetical protein ACREFX_00065 [Opitutaceae bacterium]
MTKIPASLVAAAILAVAGVANTLAQSVLPSEPPEAPIPQAVLQAEAANQAPPPEFVPPPTPFQFGPIVLRPHLSYSYLNENGLPDQAGTRAGTVLQRFAPGLLADLGPNWSLNYTPTWMDYSNADFHGGVDQIGNLAGAYNPSTWQFQLSQSYSNTSDPEIETGRQTEESSYGTVVSADDSLSDRLAIQTSLQQQISSANVQYPESRNWSTQDGIRLNLSPLSTLSLSGQGGYFEVSGSMDGYNFSPVAGWTVQSADRKWALDLSGGVQDQVFYQHRRSVNQTSPNVHLSVDARPITSTHVQILAGENESFSGLTAQATRNKDWGADWDQRLFTHFDLNVGANRSEIDYESISSAGSAYPSRSDQVNSIHANFGVIGLLKRGSITLIYQTSHDASSVRQYSFSSRELGLQVGYSY